MAQLHAITVVGLGNGTRDDLTLGALGAMRKAQRLILRTSHMQITSLLQEEGIAFTSLDSLYESAEDFDALDAACADAVRQAAAECDTVFAVFDPSSDGAVERLRPDVSRIFPPAMPQALVDAPRGEKRLVSAYDLHTISSQGALILTELDSKLLAGTCKAALLEFWPQEAPVLFYPQGSRTPVSIPLEDLDRMPERMYGHLCAAALQPQPLTEKTRCDVEDLYRVMERLRAPGGCPWDREQTHKTLRNYLIEEAYETAEAVDREEWDHVAEELGDVLLQVVFQANIGRQYGNFDLGDVTTAIVRKMIRRHPHVFGSVRADSGEEVSRNWDAIKRADRGQQTIAESLRDLPAALPSLMRAEKMQARAARAGHDCPDLSSALKAAAACAEKAAALKGEALAEELGSLLFACVAAVRKAGLESEVCLQHACGAFLDRFEKEEAGAENPPC